MCLLATLVGCGDIDFSEDKVTSPPSIDSTKVERNISVWPKPWPSP